MLRGGCHCHARIRRDHVVVLMSTLCGRDLVVQWLEEGGNHGVRQAQRKRGELMLHFHREALGMEVSEAERHRSAQL